MIVVQIAETFEPIVEEVVDQTVGTVVETQFADQTVGTVVGV